MKLLLNKAVSDAYNEVMDAQSPPNNTPVVPVSPQNNFLARLLEKFKSLSQKQIIFIIGGLVILTVLIIVLAVLLSKKEAWLGTKDETGRTENSFSPVAITPPENAIAKVGEEFIYQTDLDIELANYPGPKGEATKKTLLDKLVNDSIILQAAQKANLVKLDPEVYNADNKNYGKRINDIKNIQTKMDSEVDQISGKMVSLWFYNYKPAKIGLEKGKEEAFRRISALHARVVNKEITMNEAANIIKSDPSYGDLDFGYENNAISTFSSNKGKRIAIDQGFDPVLWKTNPGEITEVYLGKNTNEFTNELVESFYVFGQVDKKIDNGNSQTYAQWLEAQKGNYEVTYF